MIKFLKDMWRDFVDDDGEEDFYMGMPRYSICMRAGRWLVSRRDAKGWCVLQEKDSMEAAEEAVAMHVAIDAKNRERRRKEEESTVLFDANGRRFPK